MDAYREILVRAVFACAPLNPLELKRQFAQLRPPLYMSLRGATQNRGYRLICLTQSAVSCNFLRQSTRPMMRCRRVLAFTQTSTIWRCMANKSKDGVAANELKLKIEGAGTISDLFAIHARGSEYDSDVSVAATWMQLSKLSQGGESASQDQISRLVDATERMAAIERLSSEALANTAYGVVQAMQKRDKQTMRVLDALACASAARIDQFNSHCIAKLALAFATAGHRSPALFDTLVRASAANIDQFSPAELAKTARAFAQARHPSPQLFDAFARASTAKIHQFDPDLLARLARAFVQACHSSPELFDTLA
eukprot:5578864-Pleurochrysis_carterae.AAC.1